MDGFWSPWLVGPALAAITVGIWIVVLRPLGVSGPLARFSRIREELEFDRGTAALQADKAQLEEAALAATAEMLGIPVEELRRQAAEEAAAAPAEPGAPPAGRACAPTPPLGAHALFLGGLVVGGFLAAVFAGRFGQGMGSAFEQVIGGGAPGVVALGAGGVLVGFGTSLAGGCTGGHGLTGCGRLMPGSLVATATFVASAVAFSLLLGGRAQ